MIILQLEHWCYDHYYDHFVGRILHNIILFEKKLLNNICNELRLRAISMIYTERI
jgi:hypothetical protein